MMRRLWLRQFGLTALLLAAGCSEDTLDLSDKKGPSVVSVSPEDGEKDVAVNAEILVTFDEAIDTKNFDYGGFSVQDAEGKVVKGFLAFNNDQFTFRPAQAYEYNAAYTVKVNGRITDLFGNPAKPHEWSFETRADYEAPSVPYNLSFLSLTNQSTVELEGAKDPDSYIYVDGKKTDAGFTGPFFKINLSLTKEGTNTFQLTSVDEFGNTSNAVEVTVRRDTTPPAPLTRCPSASSGLAWHDEVRSGCFNPPEGKTFYWSNKRLLLGAEWSPGADEVAYFRLGNWTSPQAMDASFTVDIMKANPAPNTALKLEAVTRDMAGNETPVAERFTRTFVYDPTPPDLGLDFSTPADVFADTGAIAVTTSTDAFSLTFFKESGSTFSATRRGPDGSETLVPFSVSDTSFSVEVANLPDGVHRFSIAATDAAGNTTRLHKWVQVDTTAPKVWLSPVTGSVTGPDVVFHVIADESVTVDWAGTEQAGTLDAVEVADSGRQHFTASHSFGGGVNDVFSTWVEDDAGNRTFAATEFTTSASAMTAPTAGWTGSLVSPTGEFTVHGLSDGDLYVLRYGKTADRDSYRYAVTYATAVTAWADPLNVFDGYLYSYNSDGTYATVAVDGLWNETVVRSRSLINMGPASISAYAFATTYADGDLAFFTDHSIHAVVDGTAPSRTQLEACSASNGNRRPNVVRAGGEWVLRGKSCFSAPAQVEALNLANPTSRKTIWSSDDETEFGVALAGGDLFQTAETQYFVGSPNALSGRGKVYAYASSTATAPTFVLEGPGNATNARFGQHVAYADQHFGDTGALAVLASGEPAVYLYGPGIAAIVAGTADHPLISYRARLELPATDGCSLAYRHELASVGDIDGDGTGDFVVTSWAESWWKGCGQPDDTFAPFASRVYVNVILGADENGGAAPRMLSRLYYRRPLSTGGNLARPVVAALGDLNADGYADFGHIDRRDGALVRVFYGHPSGVPEERILTLNFAVSDAAQWVLSGAGDANGDGYDDFLFSEVDDSDNWNLMAFPER